MGKSEDVRKRAEVRMSIDRLSGRDFEVGGRGKFTQ